MQAERSDSTVKITASAIIFALVIAALYFGRDVFVPIALAVLLSFALSPLADALERIRFPRAVAVLSVVIFAFAVIFGIGTIIAGQMNKLAGELPSYQANIRGKIDSLRGATAASGTLERAADVLSDLSKEISKPQSGIDAQNQRTLGDKRSGEVKPIPVEVRQPPPSALENIASLIAPLLHPLMTTGIVAIFVIFTLMQREDLRNRLIKLAGSHDLQKTTIALDDAGKRIGRLLLSQLALNSGFGLVTGVGLALIGIPSAALWGILAGVLRFVPYIGGVISAAFPLLLAVAVDPGWTLLIWTAGLFLIIEPLAGQAIEPLLYGRSTGISPIAVMVSATFWTSVWGPIGLVLATPLTICLVVLGRHIEGLKFLDVMFGNRPPLSPPELLYQRMLAADPAEALEKAEEFLKEKPLYLYYDEVGLKSLELAQADLARGALDEARAATVFDSMTELVDELDDHNDLISKTATTTDPEASAAIDDAADPVPLVLPTIADLNLPAGLESTFGIICAPSKAGTDVIASRMLSQILKKHGFSSSLENISSASTAEINEREVRIGLVFVSCVSPFNNPQVRYAIRRVRRRYKDAQIIACCWNFENSTETRAAIGDVETVATVHQAVTSALAACTRLVANDSDQLMVS